MADNVSGAALNSTHSFTHCAIVKSTVKYWNYKSQIVVAQISVTPGSHQQQPTRIYIYIASCHSHLVVVAECNNSRVL